MEISNRIQALAASQTLAMSQKSAELKAKGIDVINLSVGEPDFFTPAHIKEAAIKAIEDNFSFYSPVPGYMSLRKAIADKLSRENGLAFEPAQIVVGNGAKHALCNVVLTVVNPGDEVIIPTPAWVSYVEMVKLAEGTTVEVPTGIDQDFKMTPAQLESAITPRTKAIVLCSPSNPTGSVYTGAELQALVSVLERHPQIVVIADEIYEHINYTGGSFVSLASFPEIAARTVVINGVSKAYAMTGWRIGYAAARPDVIKGIMAVQSQTTSATSAISQKAAVTALQGPQYDLHDMVAEFKRRKDYVVSRLNAMPGITCPDVKGAFYVYPDVGPYLHKRFGDRNIETAVDLCQYLLDEALISTVPGEAYNVPGKIRISYSNSMENLKEALDRMEKALSALQ